MYRLQEGLRRGGSEESSYWCSFPKSVASEEVLSDEILEWTSSFIVSWNF
jgi:hypothetical protein